MSKVMTHLLVDPAGGHHKAGSGEATVRRTGFLRHWGGKGDLRQVHNTRRNSRAVGPAAGGRPAAESE